MGQSRSWRRQALERQIYNLSLAAGALEGAAIPLQVIDGVSYGLLSNLLDYKMGHLGGIWGIVTAHRLPVIDYRDFDEERYLPSPTLSDEHKGMRISDILGQMFTKELPITRGKWNASVYEDYSAIIDLARLRQQMQEIKGALASLRSSLLETFSPADILPLVTTMQPALKSFLEH